MTQYIITLKGYNALRKGSQLLSEMMEVASSIATDGVVDENELMDEFDLRREEAVKTLELLKRLGLIKPLAPPKSTLERGRL